VTEGKKGLTEGKKAVTDGQKDEAAIEKAVTEVLTGLPAVKKAKSEL
jgi:hypothetical protein